MGIKLHITDEEIDHIGVVEAGVNDGYWEYLARKEIRAVYIRGMIDATKSLKSSYITAYTPQANGVNRRLASLHRMLKENANNPS